MDLSSQDICLNWNALKYSLLIRLIVVMLHCCLCSLCIFVKYFGSTKHKVSKKSEFSMLLALDRLIMKNKLQKRNSFLVLPWCILTQRLRENANHLFCSSPVVVNLWAKFLRVFDVMRFLHSLAKLMTFEISLDLHFNRQQKKLVINAGRCSQGHLVVVKQKIFLVRRGLALAISFGRMLFIL